MKKRRARENDRKKVDRNTLKRQQKDKAFKRELNTLTRKKGI